MTDGTATTIEQHVSKPALPPDPSAIDVDAIVDPEIEAAIADLDQPASLLGGMVRYHLGQLDANLTPVPDATRRAVSGKRLRPAIALLCCAAQGGDHRQATPLAAAIELLHNFTLIHDDIQDESDTRRHRPTVWSLWGRGQAINAGDALFAAAQIALYRSRAAGIAADLTLRLGEAFARTTIEIVQGQVLDLGFEGRDDVAPPAYLDMIERKTAAIVRFAAWGGASIGGADDRQATRFGEFGRLLGLGFQTQDDLLGIWGAGEETGKPVADDIRRRKQSLPILLLRTRADRAECAELDLLFAKTPVDEEGVRRVLDLLDAYSVRASVEDRVRSLHADARHALLATGATTTMAGATLLALVESLAERLH